MSDLDEKTEDAEFIPNPKELDGVPDLSQLVYLEMKHVLHNLHYRYSFMKSKHCYTSISTILVAINPYERLPIYGEDVINEFHEAAKKGRLLTGRPHPYGVSARGYLRMIQRKQNQSMIVCGESGAGKTETTKLLMRYLAMTAPSTSMQTSIVEQQIVAASPILEAYGNAKTVMNNNSSRFGKFTKLLYDVKNGKEGYILGSYLETYLLEKSRVVFQSNNERNYHIFYFMENGLKDDNKEIYNSLYLDNFNNFWYTNQGNTSVVPSINDKDRFIELKGSLDLMRIGSEMQPDLWRLTSGILNLGNVEFTKEGDGFAKVNLKKCQRYVTAVSQLWGISEDKLIKRLETANMKVVNRTIETKIQFDQAVANRDSIAKGIYEKVFLWLVERINAELYQTDEDDNEDGAADIASILFIGILDVFGFENFFVNSLEQFCINFTNEKLQQFFNYHIIRSEQEEYIKESVFWTPISVPDNLEYMTMVEDPKIGFFTILDSNCKGPSPDPEAFMQELFTNHGKNSTIRRVKAPGSGNCRGKPPNWKKLYKGGKGKKYDGFMINHFADDVSYDGSLFITKNMESVHPDTAKMFNKSSYELTKMIGGIKDGQRRRRKKLTVTGTFHKGIKTLMKNLKATEPFFVRCVNPNTQKRNDLWTESVVEHQLRCGGLVEALKVLKLGYPTRVPYSTLYDRYHGNVTNPLIKNMGPEEFSTVLLIAFDVSEDDYELGLTKIFFKPSKAAVLDTIMAQADQPLTDEQNQKITKWIVNKRVKQMIGVTKAFLELRKRVRLVRAQQRWEWSGRVSAILGGTVLRHLGMARAEILKRKREQGALALQTFFRSNYECKRYRNHIDKVHKATKIIWTAYRRMEERNKLNKWLNVKVEETRERKRIDEENAIKAAKEAAEAAEIEKLRIEAQKREEERIEAEKLRLLEQEKEHAAKLAQKEKDDIAKAAEAKKLEQDIEDKKKIQSTVAQDLKKINEERIKHELEIRKESINRSIKISKQNAADEEAKMIEDRDAQIIRNNFPELRNMSRKHSVSSVKSGRSVKSQRSQSERKSVEDQDDDDEDDDEDDLDTSSEYISENEDEMDKEYDMEKSIKEQLKYFKKTATIGQLFLKYTGKRRRKPQDRIVKVLFDSDGTPIHISWGSGARHIDFSDIQYISYGHKTPVFDTRKDMLDEKLCLSIVGTDSILDIQATSLETALLWRRGLCQLLKMTPEESQSLADKNWESGNLPGINGKGGKNGDKDALKRGKNNRAKELMNLQRDLFTMTSHTVFRNLEEEGIWQIDEQIRDKFNFKTMYEEALKKDIPWRQWNHWIRQEVVNYLKQNVPQQQQQHYYPNQRVQPMVPMQPMQPMQPMPYDPMYPQQVPVYSNGMPMNNGYPMQPVQPNMMNMNMNMNMNMGVPTVGNLSSQWNNGGYQKQPMLDMSKMPSAPPVFDASSMKGPIGGSMGGQWKQMPPNNGYNGGYSNNGMNSINNNNNNNNNGYNGSSYMAKTNDGKQMKTKANDTADKDCTLM